MSARYSPICSTSGVPGCTAIEDRTVPEIAQKFRKGYETRAPTELLAYYDWGPAALAEDWLSDLPELVARELPSSPFRRVWVFDVGEGRILYVSPVIEGRERDSSSVDPNQHS